MNRLKTDQKVSLLDDSGKELGVTGVIAGLGHMLEAGAGCPIYIVKLDYGFYDPSGKVYVSSVVVDRTNLVPI